MYPFAFCAGSHPAQYTCSGLLALQMIARTLEGIAGMWVVVVDEMHHLKSDTQQW